MELEKKVRDAFGCVKASEGLKESTKSFLREAGRNRQAHRGAVLRLATVCAALAVFLGIGGFAFLGTPVAYVSIDVNPSLELELNRLDRVIAVRALSDPGCGADFYSGNGKRAQRGAAAFGHCPFPGMHGAWRSQCQGGHEPGGRSP